MDGKNGLYGKEAVMKMLNGLVCPHDDLLHLIADRWCIWYAMRAIDAKYAYTGKRL